MEDSLQRMTRRRALLMGGAAVAAAYGIAGGASARTAAAASTPAAFPLVFDGVDPWHATVAAAGYRPKTATVADIAFSYVEGPRNGPPLVLLHAQQMDWFSYSRVLPALAQSFHVFDVDYQGHGQTRTPAGYPMNANRIGTDLAAFLQRVVKRPAYVTGNSSGGLLTAWLAANRPHLVKAALLEDPPLFASEYPRIKQTIADRDFATNAAGADAHVEDFLLYWIQDSKPFFEKNIGPGSAELLIEAVTAARAAHPGQPVELTAVSNDTIRLFLRGMDHQYDPWFGAAFHRGTWNAGFDHAEALARIRRPTMLLHANYSWTDDHILDGAMSKQDASKVMSLLRNGTYRRIDATHVTHLDKPAEFTSILKGFFG
jgi:pimeloyl-ACP methyl ester carboxylesterase